LNTTAQSCSCAVISAKVQTPEGRWLALDARYLKRHQRMLGGVYQSVLRSELSHRFGVEWRPIVNGQAEIAGVPDELLAVFSKRTADIDDALADKLNDFRQREGRVASRWERAALTREASADTRSGKSGTRAVVDRRNIGGRDFLPPIVEAEAEQCVVEIVHPGNGGEHALDRLLARRARPGRNGAGGSLRYRLFGHRIPHEEHGDGW
jgi:hypothetical protein